MSRYAATAVVMPLDLMMGESAGELTEVSDEDDLDWSFVDIDLERQLQIIKGGRAAPIVIVVGSALVLVGVLFFGT